jgi:glycosyltransferase involved in cell wall biosynthesis
MPGGRRFSATQKRYARPVSDHPSVSLLLPVLNEIEHIDACVASLQAQDYPGSLEVLVAEGGSDDGTQHRLNQFAREATLPIRVISNPERRQSHGLNLLAAKSAADILVRVDAHTILESDYVSKSVLALTNSDAVAAGGSLRPQGTNRFGKAVSLAMQSRLAIGPGKFHHDEASDRADTVYLGAFTRSDFVASGGYRHLPFGVAEDADLYFRWRAEGRTIVLDPAIRSTYRPRSTVRGLFRQFYRYGAGKADMLYVNGRWPSWRPAAPLLLVLAIISTFLLAAVTGIRWPFWSLLAVWIVALLVAARVARRPLERIRVFAAAAVMHIAYGIGLLRGLLRRPAAVRAATGN